MGPFTNIPYELTNILVPDFALENQFLLSWPLIFNKEKYQHQDESPGHVHGGVWKLRPR